MTSDDGWSDVRPAHRLSYEVFCEEHELAWRALASSRLPDPDLVESALRHTRAALKRNWAIALREPNTEAYAWLIAKEQVAYLALGTGGTPPRSVVPDWLPVVAGADTRTGVDPESPDEQHDALYRALLRLSERQYDMIVLHYLLDLDYPKIAAYLGISESTARTTTGQGLAKLRRLLAADATTEEMR